MPKNKIDSSPTIGFGVPTETNPHHFQVYIPRKSGSIEISEHLGIEQSNKQVTEIRRGFIKRTSWTKIRTDVKNSFNDRLESRKLKPSSWNTGNNLVDRLLGKELCVLAWSIERLNKENVPCALHNWLGLRPEERWWLFGMATRDSEDDIKRGYGWRIALGYALATSNVSFETGLCGKPERGSKTSGTPQESQTTLNLEAPL